MLEINKIYNEDCLIGVKKLPDSSIDLAILDPPYINVVKADWDKQNPFTYELVSELHRVLKDTASIYVWCGIGEKSRSLLDFIPKLDSNFHFKDLITWKKQRGIGMRKGWLYTREELLWYVKDNKQFIWNKDEQYSDETRAKSGFAKSNSEKTGRDNLRFTNVWTDITEETLGNNQVLRWTKDKDKIKHLTPKPIKALERIIKLHTNENDLILDCFMGSGSTAVACIKSNRQYIGFELDPIYSVLANKRILDIV